MKHRVGSRNSEHTINTVFKIGNEELDRITANDWASAIALATKNETLYAGIDQVNSPSVPILQEEPANVSQESLNSNEIPQSAQKCSNCNFESNLPHILQKHLKSVVQCSECSKIFCGRYAKQQHKRHQKGHKPKKAKKVKKEHICNFCKKSFPFLSKLKHHQLWTACGRQ